MNEDLNAIAALLSDFNTKIADLESRYEMLKDRIIITGDSFLKTRDSLHKDIGIVKEDLRGIKNEIEKGNERMQAIMYELSQMARKEEVKVLEKYLKFWEPLKTVSREEVKTMIEDALEKLDRKRVIENEDEVKVRRKQNG